MNHPGLMNASVVQTMAGLALSPLMLLLTDNASGGAVLSCLMGAMASVSDAPCWHGETPQFMLFLITAE